MGAISPENGETTRDGSKAVAWMLQRPAVRKVNALCMFVLVDGSCVQALFSKYNLKIHTLFGLRSSLPCTESSTAW